MQVVTFSDFRQNMKSMMNNTIDEHELLIVTRQNHTPVVMMSLDDYNSWQETLYLMNSPTNHRILMQSIKNIKESKLTDQELIEDEDCL